MQQLRGLALYAVGQLVQFLGVVLVVRHHVRQQCHRLLRRVVLMRMPVIVPMLMGMGVCVRRVCTGMIGRMYGRFLVNSTHIRTSVFSVLILPRRR